MSGVGVRHDTGVLAVLRDHVSVSSEGRAVDGVERWVNDVRGNSPCVWSRPISSRRARLTGRPPRDAGE
jgi:hypothetical protein